MGLGIRWHLSKTFISPFPADWPRVGEGGAHAHKQKEERQVLRPVSQSAEPGLRRGGCSGQPPQGGGGGCVFPRLA